MIHPTVAVMAHPPELENELTTRLHDAGYHAGSWHREVLRTDLIKYLITAYPTPEETHAEVPPALAWLAHRATWLQLADVSLITAAEYQALAASMGRGYLHAPTTDGRCTAYALPADPRAPLVHALAPHDVRWAGPLESHVIPGPDWVAERFFSPYDSDPTEEP